MTAKETKRLATLHTLLADCGLEKTVATLVAEAAQVGKTNKAVQAFLEQAVAQKAAGAAGSPPIGAKSGAAGSGSDSVSSASYKSAASCPASQTTPAAAAGGAPTAGKRKRADAAQTSRPARRGEAANAPNTPFCRVRPEEVVYADERLKDNRYLSKGDVDNDFGYKAHKDLIVTRGKAFTKEKNKKKRGSYSGGRITMTSSSIKFT
ncbi:jun-like transcription factor [Coemansia helicoidea]|uniref:Jun-like transcription factor n=1 Tax=Coemansia helicoidea TaxID=1286919 RepID=A0ACC1L240_9FUNG|nr:jun-like transcription factor [Coemansia helicoidea]